MLAKTFSHLSMHARTLPMGWPVAAQLRPARASPPAAALTQASGTPSKDEDQELLFPDIPPVREDDQEPPPPNITRAPEPDNPFPDDLPGNQPKEVRKSAKLDVTEGFIHRVPCPRAAPAQARLP